MTFLAGLGLILLKLSLNVTAPRQWTLQQSITDAYITYEKALAERTSFKKLQSQSSPWPEYPDKDELTVELGKLPGGEALYGQVFRTRIADSNNLAENGGSGTLATNPSKMNVWTVQSLLVYEVGGQKYVKSRTVIRSQ